MAENMLEKVKDGRKVTERSCADKSPCHLKITIPAPMSFEDPDRKIIVESNRPIVIPTNVKKHDKPLKEKFEAISLPYIHAILSCDHHHKLDKVIAPVTQRSFGVTYSQQMEIQKQVEAHKVQEELKVQKLNEETMKKKEEFLKKLLPPVPTTITIEPDNPMSDNIPPTVTKPILTTTNNETTTGTPIAIVKTKPKCIPKKKTRPMGKADSWAPTRNWNRGNKVFSGKKKTSVVEKVIIPNVTSMCKRVETITIDDNPNTTDDQHNTNNHPQSTARFIIPKRRSPNKISASLTYSSPLISIPRCDKPTNYMTPPNKDHTTNRDYTTNRDHTTNRDQPPIIVNTTNHDQPPIIVQTTNFDQPERDQHPNRDTPIIDHTPVPYKPTDCDTSQIYDNLPICDTNNGPITPERENLRAQASQQRHQLPVLTQSLFTDDNMDMEIDLFN